MAHNMIDMMPWNEETIFYLKFFHCSRLQGRKELEDSHNFSSSMNNKDLSTAASFSTQQTDPSLANSANKSNNNNINNSSSNTNNNKNISSVNRCNGIQINTNESYIPRSQVYGWKSLRHPVEQYRPNRISNFSMKMCTHRAITSKVQNQQQKEVAIFIVVLSKCVFINSLKVFCCKMINILYWNHITGYIL